MGVKRRITKALAYTMKYLSENCLLAVDDGNGSFLVTKGYRPMGFVTSLEGRFVFIAGSITQSKKGAFLDIKYYLQSKGAYILDPLATYDSRYSTLSYKNYMVLALAMIQCADLVYVVEELKDEKEVKEELAFAEFIKKDIWSGFVPTGAITGVDGYGKYKEDEALSKTLAALYGTDKWKENT